ncbi:MAG: GNAT family N-acetyltransferase [Bacteroidales bacterium]|nr:GNAT family N-acetyltransferase [Bacteroidales bacterium]
MRSKTITLRALEPRDVELIFRWENDPAIWRVSQTLVPFSRFDIEQYVLNADKDIFSARQVRLMIDKNVDGSTVGAIDLFDFDPMNKRLGLGILIEEKQRNQGFAAEALGLLIEYVFKTLMAHQIYVNIHPENVKSIRLFERKNFQLTGRKKDWLLIENRWTDELMYQLINPYQ